MKRCNDVVNDLVKATIHIAKKTKKGTTIVLNDDAFRHIVPYVDIETLPALACCSRTFRDAAVVADVALSRFSLSKTTECHFVEFAKKDGYNAYFQDLFAGHEATHLKWGAWFAELGDIGTLKGKVPRGVTAGLLHLLKYGSKAQLEVLTKLCGEEGFEDWAVVLEAR